MSESQFEAGRVKFDQHLGPCVGDWYEMKDGGRRRFGRDLGESGMMRRFVVLELNPADALSLPKTLSS